MKLSITGNTAYTAFAFALEVQENLYITFKAVTYLYWVDEVPRNVAAFAG